MIQETERDVERRADEQARRERRLWQGPVSEVMHVVVWLLALAGVTRLLSRLARRADLHRPQLVELDVPIAGLPPALAGLRIGHLSDLHIGAHVRPEDGRRAVALLQAAAPDLIAITGDLVDHRPRDIVPAAQVVAGLSAPLGVYGVFGNHDHRPGGARLLAALSEHAPQVTMLVNAARRVPIGPAELWVAGLDSVYLGLADAAAALAPVPPGAPCLLLTHEPDVVDHLPRPVTLSLAGHAHGGQVRLSGRPLLLPPLGRRYHDGLGWSRRGPVYTSRGVGWTGVPIRLGCPAEVTVLRLVPAADTAGANGRR